MTDAPPERGTEWLVDASGCRPAALRDVTALRELLAAVVRDVGLRPAAEPQWRAFEGHGGVTGMVLLAESHLTVHTFPEHGTAAFNLYHCTPRPEWPWRAELARVLGATAVRVRVVPRLGMAALGLAANPHGAVE